MVFLKSLKKTPMLKVGVWAFIGLLFTGCTLVKRTAVNQVSRALVSGGDAFSSENDPELVRDAAPFTLKFMEVLLAESPKNGDLLTTLSSGFAQYAYAFVHMDADEVEARDFERAEEMRYRSRMLYLRARDYALRALEARHRGFSDLFYTKPDPFLGKLAVSDVSNLFWAAASWAGAVSLGKDDPELIADLPKIDYLIDAAYRLDPDFDHGAIHSFLVTYEMNRGAKEGDPVERCRYHFSQAVELSEGLQAAPYVAYAESVCIPEQDMDLFVEMLEKALAIDVNQRPEWRLVNLVNQRRAQWLLEHKDDFILE